MFSLTAVLAFLNQSFFIHKQCKGSVSVQHLTKYSPGLLLHEWVPPALRYTLFYPFWWTGLYCSSMKLWMVQSPTNTPHSTWAAEGPVLLCWAFVLGAVHSAFLLAAFLHFPLTPGCGEEGKCWALEEWAACRFRLWALTREKGEEMANKIKGF